MKPKLLARALSYILLAFAAIMLLPALLAAAIGEYRTIHPFVTAAGCSLVLGLLCRWLGRGSRDLDSLRRNEGLCVVALTWSAAGLIGAIPYLFFAITPLDAIFESVSGITTTGATILTDFSLYPRAFFFWRSLSQWLGGLGIIVLFVAILPQFGVAGRRIFFAEAPGPTEDKITPRIAQTAKALWLVYILLTVVEIVALILVGMPWFDALCNALSTMAAGGFSPHPESIMGYASPAVTWIVTLFMFLAGSNFALQYRLLLKGNPHSLSASEEFRFYLSTVVLFSVLLWALLAASGEGTVAANWRDSLFQIVSIVTTTGFSSADFALWAIPAQTVLFAMMLIGGCAGSAGGGIKVVRVMFAGKFLVREIDQMVHPMAVLPIKIDRVTVHREVQRQMLSFLLFYLLLLVVSGLVVTMIEKNAIIGMVGAAATIGNIGPGLGEIGPMGSFAGLQPVSKMLFIANMLVGRLELIPFLVMLSPEFWHFSRQ